MKSPITLDTRTFLAIFWSLLIGGLLIYIIVKHGDDKALLNLILGNIIGIVASIMGTYFSLNLPHKDNKTATTSDGTVSAEINAVVTSNVEPTVEEAK